MRYLKPFVIHRIPLTNVIIARMPKALRPIDFDPVVAEYGPDFWNGRVWGQRFFTFRTSQSRKNSRRNIGVPLNAEFLFYLFLDKKNCDALVGDLEERFHLIHSKFGRRRAQFWYWWQTAISLGPLVGEWGKKKALKPVLAVIGWAVAKGLIGHDGWLAAVVELWKRVRS